ncbi:MAG: hypothetical protein AB4063_26940 [Crocosphaera sp.]
MKTIELQEKIGKFSPRHLSSPIEERIISLQTQIESLEEKYTSDSSSANAACDYTSILVIVDKVKEFADNRQFYQLHNAIDHAVDEFKKIDAVHQDKDYILSLKILGDIKYGLNQLLNAFKVCKDSWKLVIESVDNYYKMKDKESLKQWAENLEIFGDCLEDLIKFFDFNLITKVQSIMLKIIDECSKKSPEIDIKTDTEECYRIRIRNAAGFIYRLIEFVMEEAEQEDQQILNGMTKTNYSDSFEN